MVQMFGWFNADVHALLGDNCSIACVSTWRAKGSRLLDDRSRESIEMKMNRRFLRYAHPTSTMRIVHFLCTRRTFSHVHNLLKCGSKAS